LVEQAKKEGRLVWILDALDQLSEQERDTTLTSIRQFLLEEEKKEDGKKIRVIVTSRPGAVREQLGLFLKGEQQISAGIAWQYARIEPFTVQQQYRYLYGPEKRGNRAGGAQDAWTVRKLDWKEVARHRIVPQANGADDKRSMIESIASKVSNYHDERIQQLMSNPAILAMIRTLAQDGELPTFNRRADLYNELSRRMINRAFVKLPINQQIDEDRVEEVLAAVAFVSMLTDPSSHEFRGDVVKPIRDRASVRMRQPVQTDDWRVVDKMPGVTSRSFLLSSVEKELRWSHKGVMEFYCGKFLSYNTDPSWCPKEEDSDWPVCCDRSIWKIAANPNWEEAFRFAIELGLSAELNSRNENVLLASLGMLYEVPAKGTGWERPTRLMFEAWSLLESLPACDWYDAVKPVPLERGGELIKRYRGQFEAICQDSSKPGHAIATQMLKNFCLCPSTDDADPSRFHFSWGDPLRAGKITEPFELGKYTVTNAEYELFDPAHQHVKAFTNYVTGLVKSVPIDELVLHPVVEVDWYSAWCFCRWLGAGYRLPSEKEWEYACRARTKTGYHFDEGLNQENANFNRKIGHTTRVGSYPGNAYGLHDMHGNVWEWCSNWYGSDMDQSVRAEYRDSSAYPARVLRGGSWLSYPLDCRSAYRNGSRLPSFRYLNVGFRVARARSRKP
jgi:formylglycine-generating enzyme required for sulfatase activity